MKTEFYTGSLDSITHWLNIKATQVIEGHTFTGSKIELFPQGLIAQAIFLTPDELETGNYGMVTEEED